MLNLTEKAIKEIKYILEKEEDKSNFIRFSISGGGCAGFQYSMKLDSNFDNEKDNLIEQEGVKLVFSKRILPFAEGITIDFNDNVNERGFSFDNPNSKKSCGCGKSFEI